MPVILKNLLLALGGGLLAAGGLILYLDRADPWALQTRDVQAVDVEVALPDRSTWVETVTNWVGPERLSAWLEIAMKQALSSASVPPETPQQPAEEPVQGR